MADYRLSEPAFCTMDHAMVLSDIRRSPTVGAHDFVGAMCITNMERLSTYWHDPAGFEAVALPDPEARQLAAQVRAGGAVSILKHRGGAGGAFKPFAAGFREIWERATEMAVTARKGKSGLVFPEHFLLAIVEQPGSELARQLIASGLRVDALRRDVERGLE